MLPGSARIAAVKAIRIHEDGGPDVLRYEDAPEPVAGPGEVLVGIRAASLNHLDLWIRRGLPSVPKPRILGADGAGVVAGLGEGVGGFRKGDRVVINPGLDDGAHIVGEHMDGTHAEFVTIPAGYVHHLPVLALLRAGGRLPARLRDRLPDAGHPRARPGGRVGARLGDRLRGRHRVLPDRPGARGEGDRDLVPRREACAATARRLHPS